MNSKSASKGLKKLKKSLLPLELKISLKPTGEIIQLEPIHLISRTNLAIHQSETVLATNSIIFELFWGCDNLRIAWSELNSRGMVW